MRQVKASRRPRRYDASNRQEKARDTRERIIDCARAELLDNGYAGATIAAIAARAGVSVETIYKAFGGKPGLVRAIVSRGLEGRDPRPAEERSNAIRESEPDPRAIIDRWGGFMAEIAPIVSPILLLARAAAAAAPELVSLLDEIDESRLSRMRSNAEVLARRGFLREGVGVDTAAEIMWTFTAPELYELLVVRRGWSPAKFGAFAAESMKSALLPR